MAKDALMPAFMQLSSILTGYEGLQKKVGVVYFQNLDQTYGKDFHDLLSIFDAAMQDKLNKGMEAEQIVRNNIWNDVHRREICQNIIRFWYNASVSITNSYVPGNVISYAPTTLTYYDQLMWKTVEAHPLAVSGGYVGYWRYAPEN